MPRLSIDLSEQQHQHLKVLASLNGQTIKDYVLSRAFSDVPGASDMTEEAALQAMRDLLDRRLQQARDGETVARSADEMKALARQVRDGTA
ncbi:antitoxin [Amorphus sp. 3PC139-8]|uniref:antitoxin n=1 Tax=Amorphus sp. 3PC139-8 TaxID=2735676 RepID=UPI00345E0341